jgi:hypothetical protein
VPVMLALGLSDIGALVGRAENERREDERERKRPWAK